MSGFAQAATGNEMPESFLNVGSPTRPAAKVKVDLIEAH
jgi:hypothetical protein